jgi:UDP-N-acetylmuramate dehydrogenase
MDQFYNKLKEFGHVKINESLAKHVTFKIGGPARFFITVCKTERLIGLLDYLSAKTVNYLILSGGSNLLPSDRGFDGLAIKVANSGTPKISENGSGFDIEIEAGVNLGLAVNLAVKNSLAGMDWAVGIPGSFGGAIAGNAGAMGKDISTITRWVEIWRNGEILKLEKNECKFGYRNSIFKNNNDVILRACVFLKMGDKKEIIKKMQEHLARRKHVSFPSAGSFFKNLVLDKWPGNKADLPELFLKRGTVPAGWIIEQSGLIGLTFGGAKISNEHGNCIVNFDSASQADILSLVEEIRQKVYNKFGVELDPEVQIVK